MKDKVTTKKPIKKIVNKKEPKTITKNEAKKPRGQQPKYYPWMCEYAKRLAKQGTKQKEIYKILGITEATGIKYKKEHPEFAKAVLDGYQDPIKVAEEKLYKLVKGYEFDSEEIVVVSDGSQMGSHWERVPVKKRIEPNMGAIKYALNNWKPRKTNPLDGYGEMLEVTGKMEYKVIPDEILEDKE